MEDPKVKKLSSEEVAARIRSAMDDAQPKVTSAAVARACQVTPQGVNSWRKTGRVHKTHLRKIAELTGQPLDYFIEADYNAESDSAQAGKIAVRWLALPPFLRPGVVSALSDAERIAKEQGKFSVVQSPTGSADEVPHFPSGTRERAKRRKTRRA